MHGTPKPRDIDFDGLVRKTASGDVVPVEFLDGGSIHRFWVVTSDRERYYDILGGAPQTTGAEKKPTGRASSDAPTCRPQVTLVPPQRTVDWSDRGHWDAARMPCRYCGAATNMRDPQLRPSCKVCHEAHQPT
ncbi:hypothetical protein [Streptomyces rubiginosohelvolus]|uniref:hypothetical protein n=1 Tax=Streptomyces rubiginosohelvolus TaxID=67362 RepID=UPI0035DC1302